MIDVQNVKKTFSPGFALEIESLHINKGDRVALIGMNGSGKSTLLRLIAGLYRPDSGSVGVSVSRKRVGYQPQSPYAFRGTARYNVSVGGLKAGADGLIDACLVRELLDRKMSLLSGGERQRVFLARLLTGGYELLLLDEPLSAADLKTGEVLNRTLLSYCEERGATLVFTSHTPAQAFGLATRAVLLDNGRVAEEGQIGAFRQPRSDFGRRFFAQWKIE